jgi:hypothetical protein
MHSFRESDSSIRAGTQSSSQWVICRSVIDLVLFLNWQPSATSQSEWRRTGLKTAWHCHNCQQFGHVSANCRQPPRCLWCGGGHLHKECPEKDNAASTPACCNWKLLEGENPHPANYRGCRHTKEKLQKKTAQRAPKPTTGRVFSATRTTPGVSFASALRGSTQQVQQQQERQVLPAARLAEKQSVPAPTQHSHSGQSVPAPTVNSQSLNMVRVITVMQLIMTELSGAAWEDNKLVAITKLF